MVSRGLELEKYGAVLWLSLEFGSFMNALSGLLFSELILSLFRLVLGLFIAYFTVFLYFMILMISVFFTVWS